MKPALASFLAISVLGCGTYENNVPIQAAETEASDDYLAGYVSEFYDICQQFSASNRCRENKQKLKYIKFVDSFDSSVDPSGSVAGVCWWKKNTRRIEIKKDAVPTGSWQERGLVFHELGHCLLDLGHSNPENKMIMNPYVLSERTYGLNWERMESELFQFVLSFVDTQEFDSIDDKEIPIF